MNVSSVCPEYFAAAMTGIEIPQGLTPEKFLIREIRQNSLRFFYRNATYNNYQMKYQLADEQVIRDRKWVAIPNALLAGACKTVYDLSNAIFKAFKGDSRGFTINMYRASRDLEEAYGWIVTLFDDVLGSYHVQQSLFHKECYSCFENFPRERGGFLIGSVRVPYFGEARKITLKAFYEMDEATQEEKIELFELEEVIASFGGKEVFFQKLAEANQEVLALVNLVDLKLDCVQPKISYAIMTDVDFKALTLGQIKDANASQMKVISERLKQFAGEPALTELPEDVMSITLVQFGSLSGSQISERVETIPPILFPMLSDVQLQILDLTRVSEVQLSCLFGYINGKEEKRRFALLSTPQVQSILSKLDRYILKHMSDAQLQTLDLTELSESQLRGLFDYIDGEEEKRRLRLLIAPQLQSILIKLDCYILKHMSDAQLQTLDLTELSEIQLDGLFGYIDGKEEKRRFALLSTPQVQSILSKLDRYILKHMSDAQLQRLDLTELSESQLDGLFGYIDGEEEKRRLRLLIAPQLQSILRGLNGSYLRYVEREVLRCLDISGLSQEQINALFPTLSREAIRQEGSGNYLFFKTTVNGVVIDGIDQRGYSEQNIDSIISERTRDAQAVLTALTEEQINSIRDKLSLDHLALVESLAVVNA